MNKDSFRASFAWFRRGAVFLVLAWVVAFYVPIDGSRWLALLVAILGLFALWQSDRVARIYRKGDRLITAGIAIIFAAPVLAKNFLFFLSKLIAALLENELSPSLIEALGAVQQASLSWVDAFLVAVGFGLIGWGVRCGKEPTEVVRIDESADSIRNRVDKHQKN